MLFTGKITQVTEQSGTNKYGEQYHGVNIIVVEQNTANGVYNNKAVVYVKDATPEQYPVDTIVSVEARTDIEPSRSGSGRIFNTVYCYLVNPENY